jgi:hypothetical protein
MINQWELLIADVEVQLFFSRGSSDLQVLGNKSIHALSKNN